jgi:hypothetical protein
MPAGHRDAQAIDMAARLTAAALEMRLKKNETLPTEVRTAIDTILATVQGYEERIASIEGFQSALIREATTKLKGAA